MLDEASEAKIAQMKAVFAKAVDVTINSVGPRDLEDCFGDLRGDFGASMDNALLHSLSRSRERLEVEINHCPPVKHPKFYTQEKFASYVDASEICNVLASESR